ncbi:MAG: hypothetical protein ACPL7O_07450, partial [Armatimonadota bacterium]
MHVLRITERAVLVSLESGD